jgi:hypothetical protein
MSLFTAVALIDRQSKSKSNFCLKNVEKRAELADNFFDFLSIEPKKWLSANSALFGGV